MPELTKAQKELVLLEIISAMGGVTDSSDYAGHWLNWFCDDAGGQTDTFNRCNEKGWLSTGHDTSFDASTTRITEAGRAVLARTALAKAEPKPCE